LKLLTVLYETGYDEINIKFDKDEFTDYKVNNPVKISESIKKYLERFIGLEVISQKSNNYLLKDVSAESVKEFDAISSNTVFEFKFSLSLNKLYQQVIGVDAIRLPHLKVLTDNPKLQNIRNIVYFGESDNGKVMKAVELFIAARPELHSKVALSGTNGVSIRLSLEETREFLLAPSTIALLRQEERGHLGRYLPKDFEIALKSL